MGGGPSGESQQSDEGEFREVDGVKVAICKGHVLTVLVWACLRGPRCQDASRPLPEPRSAGAIYAQSALHMFGSELSVSNSSAGKFGGVTSRLG